MRSFGLLVLILAGAACADLKRAPAPSSEPRPDADEPAIALEPNAPAPATEATPPTADRADAGAATPYAPPSNVDRICTAFCDFRARCTAAEEEGRAGCIVGCNVAWGKQAGHLRTDYVQFLQGCFHGLSCAHSEAACFDDWIAIEPTPDAVPAVHACNNARKDCTTVNEDDCDGLVAYDDATRAASEACFSGSCTEIPACLQAVRGE